MDEDLIDEIMRCQIRVWLARKRRAAWKPPTPLTPKQEKAKYHREWRAKRKQELIQMRLKCNDYTKQTS